MMPVKSACCPGARLQHDLVVALCALLLLAGDVERNPGPNGEHCLTMDDLPTLVTKVTEIEANWRQLGIQLKFHPGILDSIQTKALGDPTKALEDLLTRWLKRADPPPTLEALARAVKSRSIGNELLASSLLEKQGEFPSLQRGNEVHHIAPLNHGRPPKDMSELMSPTSPESRENIGVHCRADRLDREAQDLYTGFVLGVERLLKQNAVGVNSLLLAWACLDEEGPSSELNEAKDVTSFLRILAQQYNQVWYNYDRLASIAKHFGGRKGKRLVESYEKQLKRPAKEMVGKIKLPKEAAELVVKVKSRRYDEEDVRNIRNTLARLLKRDPEEFHLKTVKEGCIEYTYVIPAELCEPIKSLVKDMSADLMNFKVMSLTVNGECVWTHAENRQATPSPVTKEPPKQRDPSGRRTNVPLRHITRSVSGWDEWNKPESRHWMRSPLVALAFVATSALLLASGMAFLLWAGLKQYSASDNHYDAMLGGLCLVLGLLCCFCLPLSGKGKQLRCACLCGVLLCLTLAFLYHFFIV